MTIPERRLVGHEARRVPRPDAARRWPWLALAAAVATLALYGLLAGLGWPFAASACLEGVPCWCEAQHPGWIREPWNTWSNLPVLAGSVALAARAVRTVDPRRRAVLHVFAYGMWAQAAGAMYFHGSLTQWTRLFDKTSVLIVWGAILCTSLLRLGWIGLRELPLAVAASSALATVYIVGFGLDLNLGGLASLASFLAAEAVLRRREQRGSPWLFRLTLAAFVASLLAWALSIPGSPVCESAFPSHALWHLSVGVAVFSLALHASRAARGHGTP